jgi:DNA-directed RNA polymerase specialized sigma24 family protein
MNAEALVDELMRLAPDVHGAAVAASRDADSAARVTERVLGDAARNHAPGQSIDRRRLVERAIRLGVRLCPAEGFAALDERDREAIALARLGGYRAPEIARVLETSPGDVKRRLSRGLLALTATIPATSTQPAPT